MTIAYYGTFQQDALRILNKGYSTTNVAPNFLHFGQAIYLVDDIKRHFSDGQLILESELDTSQFKTVTDWINNYYRLGNYYLSHGIPESQLGNTIGNCIKKRNTRRGAQGFNPSNGCTSSQI